MCGLVWTENKGEKIQVCMNVCRWLQGKLEVTVHRGCFTKYKLGVAELGSAVSSCSYCDTHILTHTSMSVTSSLEKEASDQCITNNIPMLIDASKEQG